MTLVSSFEIPFSSHINKKLGLKNFKKNSTTILLGENGTRKSVILRYILDDALASHSPETWKVKRPSKISAPTEFFSSPSLVVAISPVPTDRFPAKPQAGELGSNSKYDSPIYKYLGPRTARNLLSRNQSIYEFTLAILKNQQRLHEKFEFLKYLTHKTKIAENLIIGFNMSPRSADLTEENLISVLTTGWSTGVSGRITNLAPWLKAELQQESVLEALRYLIRRMAQLPSKPTPQPQKILAIRIIEFM